MSGLRKLNVLVADNDEKISAILVKVLKTFGFNQVHVVEDGTRALNYMQHEPIDLVLTDWDMAPMGGIEFTQHLRNDATSPNPFVPVVMVTGRASRKDVEAARDAGVTEFLIKPFMVEDLRRHIESIVKNPRPFVFANSFVGPDRRRKRLPPPNGKDRRTED